MENFFRSKGLWSTIKIGIVEPTSAAPLTAEQTQQLEEAKKNDHKVKHYLYQAIDRETFEQILDRRTSKISWESMRRKFCGNDRVKKSLLQKLRRDFEVLEMKETENVKEYFTKVLAVTNQMRSNGEALNDSKVVEKILRTLSEKLMYVVVSIEKSKEIKNISLDELQSSLSVHEQKFKKVDKHEDQVLKVTHGGGMSSNRGRGIGSRGRGFNGRGRGRGRGRDKSTVECYKCHRLGHFQNECPMWEEEANYAYYDEKEEMLLMAYIEEEDGDGKSDLNIEETAEKLLMTYGGKVENMREKAWFLDLGCSNHMS